MSRSTYAALFARYGVLYGPGDGSTTFNLPNITDRFPVAAGGLYEAGATGGAAQVALTEAQNGPHTHANPNTNDNSLKARFGLTAATTNPETTGNIMRANNTANVDAPLGASVHAHSQPATGSSGEGLPHENRPPYFGMFVYVKVL